MKKINLKGLVSKLNEAQMKMVVGGSSFPEPLCTVECSDGTLIGTSQCHYPPSNACGNANIVKCTC